MTADEEAEVQAELDALEREAAGVSVPQPVPEAERQKVPQLPDAPTAEPVVTRPEPQAAERTKQQQKEQQREPERQAMLA